MNVSRREFQNPGDWEHGDSCPVCRAARELSILPAQSSSLAVGQHVMSDGFDKIITAVSKGDSFESLAIAGKSLYEQLRECAVRLRAMLVRIGDEDEYGCAICGAKLGVHNPNCELKKLLYETEDLQ